MYALVISGYLVLGICLGIGIAVTYSNVRSAKGPRERAFCRFHSLAAWGVICLFLALMYWLPTPWRYVVLLPYFIHLPIAVYRASMKRQLLVRLDHMEQAGEPPHDHPVP